MRMGDKHEVKTVSKSYVFVEIVYIIMCDNNNQVNQRVNAVADRLADRF
jgi:hypothetical protein